MGGRKYLSFASQKNDMLLRNMIYLLNANMIDSTASNMIFLLRKSDYSVNCQLMKMKEKFTIHNS